MRCVVLTGAGRGFSAGQDLKDHIAQLNRSAEDAAAGDVDGGEALQPDRDAARHDAQAGGRGRQRGRRRRGGRRWRWPATCGWSARSGGFNLAFAGVALSCDTGSSWWLPRLVGVAKAKELLLLPRTVRAEEALELGLATRVVDDDELAGQAAHLAAQLAAGPTLAYASIRRAVAFSAGHDLADSLANEEQLMRLTGASADHRAATEAFVAKTTPEFTGR